MKKLCEENQLEIRRLKQQNADMHDELKECAKMFRTAEKFQKDKLYAEIGDLHREIEKLNAKIKFTESNLDELARTHQITWLDSMLDYCK